MAMKIASTDFTEGGELPKKFTCDGKNENPNLSWENVPEGTKSLALILEDPDAPRGNFIHWAVKDIPPQTRSIGEGSIPKGARMAKNQSGEKEYFGPCPPSGTHRYVFRLYALDVPRLEGESPTEMREQLRRHKLAEAATFSTYSRKER